LNGGFGDMERTKGLGKFKPAQKGKLNHRQIKGWRWGDQRVGYQPSRQHREPSGPRTRQKKSPIERGTRGPRKITQGKNYLREKLVNLAKSVWGRRTGAKGCWEQKRGT